ncbi:MAG: hypothetical protein HYY84_16280 [Deltaproteobacteria bacterium]|nr:hypothetical protein [Deltaproteobacteria bacterium]
MSEQKLVAINAPSANPVGYDEYGRAQTARNGSRLQGYQRDDEYDIQSVHYQYTDQLDTRDSEGRALFENPNSVENFDNAIKLQDEEYVALADWTVQRYLDLCNDKSGKVTPSMKAELRAQALKLFERAGDGSQFGQTDALGSVGSTSFETLTQLYLNKGTTREFMAPVRYWDGKDTTLVWGETLRRRAAVQDMVSKISTVESRLQPPTPGKKEADAMWAFLGRGTLIEGATNRASLDDALLS